MHWRAGSKRSFTAIRKEAGLFCGSFLRKGEVFVFVGRNQNLQDLRKGEEVAYVELLQTRKNLEDLMPTFYGRARCLSITKWSSRVSLAQISE